MKHNLWFILVLMATVSSCKCSKKSTTSAPSAPQTATTSIPPAAEVSAELPKEQIDDKQITDADSFRLVVSFISIGEGTDAFALEKLEGHIENFFSMTKIKVAYVKKHWGREGESDNIFSLSELNSEQQQKFISGLREIFKGNSLVQVSENQRNRFKK